MNTFYQKVLDLVRRGDQFIATNGAARFSEFALNELNQSHLSEDYDRSVLAAITLDPAFKVIPNYPFLEFSDLPLTLARGEHCLIDVYVWYRRPTVIHNHHFSGAFMCLEGNNIDLEFEYRHERDVGLFHGIGKLTLKEKSHLQAGSAVEIRPLDGYIHQNHHQAELTVNLCFRTNFMIDKTLSHYLIGGLRIDKDKELLQRNARVLGFLRLGELPEDVEFSMDDVLAYLIDLHRSKSGNRRVLQLKDEFERRVRDELGFDLGEELSKHEAYMAELEDSYD
jgi:hypothetical protein